MKNKIITGINHEENLKIVIGSGLINSWIINFQGSDINGISYSFSFRFNIYTIALGLRQICMLNTTVSVTREDDNWHYHEDKFVEIKAKKKIRYDMLSAIGDFAKIEGDYDSLKIWALIPWATIDFELRSDKSIIYDNETGKITLNGNDVFGYLSPEWDAEGTIEIDGKSAKVSGKAMLERSVYNIPKRNSIDKENTIRLSIICEDKTKLSIRSIIDCDTKSEKAWVDYMLPDGTTGMINLPSLVSCVTDYWECPDSGQKYPLYYHITIPELDIDLDARPMIDDQEATAKKKNECRYYGGGYVENGICFYEITGLWE